jgi:serine/threonine protein phosphatase PrpC
MRLRAWSLSDVGRRREQNEDSLLEDERLGLYAVADGMGGHLGGAYASQLALKVMHREVRRAAGDYQRASERLRGRLREGPVGGRESRRTDAMPAVSDGETLDVELLPLAPAAELMELAAMKASAAIYEAAQRDPKLAGMGTTMTAMLYDEG